MLIAHVAILGPLSKTYDYEVPTPLQDGLVAGKRVWVPLRNRHVEGLVLSISLVQHAPAVRPIESVFSNLPLPQDLIDLIVFIADYYFVSIGDAVALVLPSYEKAKSKIVLQLTPSGHALLQSHTLLETLLPLEKQILSSLAESPKTISVLMKLFAPLGGSSIVSDLIKQWIKSGKISQDGSNVELVRRNEDPLVFLHESAPSDLVQILQSQRKKTQAQVIEKLQKNGALLLSQLREEIPRATTIVRQLASAEFVSLRDIHESHDPSFVKQTPLSLNDEQQAALHSILRALENPSAPYMRNFLLQGVTGSGKTEVYLQVIDAALKKGLSALVLVPEIGLTPQLFSRFYARFGAEVAVLHSAMTDKERSHSWQRILSGNARIALGPRSALFAPLHHLGVIIVDEEHDSSFKQQEGVRYHGRDLALVRAQKANAIVVLGSATPSLESLALVEKGKLVPLKLTRRATGSDMPRVEVVDLRQHLLRDEDVLLSAPLAQAIQETLDKKEQTILFLNRRGYTTSLYCAGCGYFFECNDCAVTLTYHKTRHVLICHYCGHSDPFPSACPKCKNSSQLRQLGLGTQKIEEHIKERFPSSRVVRLDRDTADGKSMPKIMRAMHHQEIDILIGTQMLSKGHDFPMVTLVGVLLADTAMGLPDFRASERTFQLLSQVAGRSGRAERPGRVVIQTYHPEHPAVICTKNSQDEEFFIHEMQMRRSLVYPPFSRMILLRFDGVDESAVRSAAQFAFHQLDKKRPVRILGPAPAPLSKLKGKVRWQIILRAEHLQDVRALARQALNLELPKGVRLTVDVDPTSVL